MIATDQITSNWPEECFEPNPFLQALRRGTFEAQLEQLKEQLLKPMLASVEHTALVKELCWVANEAAAMAWASACPILVLPALLEEKIRSARSRWERQRAIWQR